MDNNFVSMVEVSILWFRNGLRLHDNPALHSAIQNEGNLLPIFIFDGESGGTKKAGFKRMKFLIESLKDLDMQFRANGGRLYIFRGQPLDIFRQLQMTFKITTVCFEQECEPIWKSRDDLVKIFCKENNILCIEKISQTLWDPHKVIKTNNNAPPLTYQRFLIPEIEESLALDDEDDNDIIKKYRAEVIPLTKWKGGETEALKCLRTRLEVEKNSFIMDTYLPNQVNPDLLQQSSSISPYLCHGCLSIRKFYWNVQDLYKEIQKWKFSPSPSGTHVTGQLIWREYFHTMSVNNEFYGEIVRNPICLHISWREPSEEMFRRWKYGQTGYPLVDAAMRQLLCEGWIHHFLRNMVSTFLTRGALWYSWTFGLDHFLKYLLDADWSVCAGNWMWVSSSAFEALLDTSSCVCPISLGRRLDPTGLYIKRFVPELKVFPSLLVHEPWTASLDVQTSLGCVLGADYPHRIVDFETASKINMNEMQAIRKTVTNGSLVEPPPHCRPSSDNEIRNFFWLPDEFK